MIFVYLKDTLAILLPFVLIHCFFQYFYQTSLLSVAVWWFKYFFKMDYKEVVLIGLFFTFFAFWASVGSIIQNISLAFHGEEHQMVYVGNDSKRQSLLYHAKDLTFPPMKTYNFTPPNISFKNIYQKTVFIRDKNTDRLGAPKAYFSWSSLLQTLWIMLILTPIFLGVLHALAYPVSVNAESLDFTPEVPIGDAFTALLEKYGISPYQLIAFPIVIFFLPLILPSFADKEDNKFGNHRAITLPQIVISGNEVNVLPVNAHKDIIESVGNGQDVDTGMRNIIFKFEEGFKIPVYVTYKFDSKAFPNLEEEAYENIKNGTFMKVRITSDLGLELVKN